MFKKQVTEARPRLTFILTAIGFLVLVLLYLQQHIESRATIRSLQRTVTNLRSDLDFARISATMEIRGELIECLSSSLQDTDQLLKLTDKYYECDAQLNK